MVFVIGCQGVDTVLIDQRQDGIMNSIEESIELDFVEQRTEYFKAEDEVRVGDWKGVGASGK